MYKKWVLIILCMLMVLQFTACGDHEDCDHEYESEIVREASYSQSGKIKKVCIFCDDEQTETIAQLENPIELKVLDVSTFVEEKPPLVMPDGMEIFQPSTNWMVFKIKITNNSSEDITSVAGQLTMSDGDNEIILVGTFDETIPANDSVILSNYGMSVNHNDLTMADNMLYGSDFDELTFDFELQKIEN